MRFSNVGALHNHVVADRVAPAEPDVLLAAAGHERIGAFRNPDIVMEFLGQIPLPALGGGVAGGGTEAVLPVFEALRFHPERIVLADMLFIGVVTGEFDVFKAVEGPVELAPEFKILLQGIGLNGGIVGVRQCLLEVDLAHQCGVDAGLLEIVTHHGHGFR